MLCGNFVLLILTPSDIEIELIEFLGPCSCPHWIVGSIECGHFAARESFMRGQGLPSFQHVRHCQLVTTLDHSIQWAPMGCPY